MWIFSPFIHFSTSCLFPTTLSPRRFKVAIFTSEPISTLGLLDTFLRLSRGFVVSSASVGEYLLFALLSVRLRSDLRTLLALVASRDLIPLLLLLPFPIPSSTKAGWVSASPMPRWLSLRVRSSTLLSSVLGGTPASPLTVLSMFVEVVVILLLSILMEFVLVVATFHKQM